MKLAIDLLPDGLRDIVGLIGLPATLRLVEAYGGTTIWPAKTGDKGAHLAEVLGAEAANALTAHYREPIYIPMALAALRAVAHDAIRAEGDALERQGWSARAAVAHLARKYRHSDRYIWAIRKRADHGGQVAQIGQGELF